MVADWLICAEYAGQLQILVVQQGQLTLGTP